jgi:hypothetical protein
VKDSVHLLEQVGYTEQTVFGEGEAKRFAGEKVWGQVYCCPLQQEAVCDSAWTGARRASRLSAADDACPRPRRGQEQEMDGFEEKCNSRG